MKEAIQKAMECGWKHKYGVTKESALAEKNWEEVTSDPLFWQALGKALGWNQPHITWKGVYSVTAECHYHWHLFIDHLAEGKDAESFFNELLK